MFLLIDSIILLIVVFCVFSSAKKGFVRVLIEVAGFIAIGILTFTISTPLSHATYDKIIGPSFIESATNKTAESTEQKVNDAFETLPDFITDYAKSADITPETVTESINKTTENSVENTIKNVSEEIIKPVACELLSLIYSALLLIILSVVVVFVARAVNKLFSFSFVGKINKFLGGLVGVIKGAAFSAIYVLLIKLALSFFENGFWVFTPQNIEKTYLFKFILGLLPF